MITVAILEQNIENVKKIKEMLIGYSIRKNLDFRTLWFSTKDSQQKLMKYAPSIHIAIISLDKGGGLEKGMEIYSVNTECRILYYSSKPCELEPLFHSRPIEFHLWTENDSIMLEKLDAIISELMRANTIFRYQTRRKMILIPERNIFYLQSNLKNVEIHKSDGEMESLFTKLSEVEKRLSRQFVRIHQSFIVNVEHIRSIRRDTHMVILKNGECIPISDARYQEAVTRIEELSENMQFCPLKMAEIDNSRD